MSDLTHAEEPPVGFVDTMAFPAVSTATQKLKLGHEMDFIRRSESTRIRDQVGVPEDGFVDKSISPSVLTATHKFGPGQAIELIV